MYGNLQERLSEEFENNGRCHGRDNAPDEIVKGCVEAVKMRAGFEVELIGVESEIKRVLKKYHYPQDRITIAVASQTITNEDKPTDAIRHKKDSSLAIGLNKIKENHGYVFITAGSTGAPGCNSSDSRQNPGVLRPALHNKNFWRRHHDHRRGMNTLCRPMNYVSSPSWVRFSCSRCFVRKTRVSG